MSASSTPVPKSQTSVVGSNRILSDSSSVEVAFSPESNFEAKEGVSSSTSREDGSVRVVTAARAESSTVPKDTKKMSSDMSKIKFTVGGESEDDEERALQLNGRGNGADNQGSMTSTPRRDVTECLAINQNSELGAKALTDEEVISLVKAKHIPAYHLEKALDDLKRGISIRLGGLLVLGCPMYMYKTEFVNYDFYSNYSFF
jgi:hypothetical protein